MNLIFDRGDRTAPAGHALIYFRADDGGILATYVSVPPIPFDISKYVPGFLAGAMQGLDLGNAMVVTPLPPSPEEVASLEYLQALAERRRDDLIFAGGANRADVMRLMAEASEAARQYGELYGASETPSVAIPPTPVASPPNDTFAGLSEQEKLYQLSSLTGRLRDSLGGGRTDPVIEEQMQELASSLPTKYRVRELIYAAREPGERGRHMAELYLERCFKLYNEEYLDLERLDREIEAARG